MFNVTPREGCDARTGSGKLELSHPSPYTYMFLPKLILEVQKCSLSNTCSCCFGRAVGLALPLLYSVISAKHQHFMRNANGKKKDVTVLNPSQLS